MFQNCFNPNERQMPLGLSVVGLKQLLRDMQLRQSFLRKRWNKTTSEVISLCMSKYRRCMLKMKKYVRTDSQVDHDRRKSSAKLHPPLDRPIRRAASKLKRKPTDELEKLRRKGEDWTANDLFRFQYSDPEAGSPEERRQLCYEWLDRLHDISKKYCYLAWYEAAIYACYYRLAPIVTEVEERKALWNDVRMEYAEIFLMGRRIWRRPIHPSRLRVFYDMAMLCVRFGEVKDDLTIPMFRDSLEDATNFDFKVQNEVEFAKSIDKITRLENYVIDQFYSRRRSSGSTRSSFRSSFRSRRNIDRSPSRKFEQDDSIISQADDQPSTSKLDDTVISGNLEGSLEALSLVTEEALSESLEPQQSQSDQTPKSILIPSIVVHAPSRTGSFKGGSSPAKPVVHFEGSTNLAN